MSTLTPAQPEPAIPLKWYQGLDRYCWIVLIVAGLGWLFDTMDQNIFTLVRAPSMKELLSSQYSDPVQLDAAVKRYGGIVTSIFLIGWSVGGFLFGMLGDRLGRTRTMIATILVYAIFTGASGLVHGWKMYAVMRFFTALGVGGEWAAGASLVAESFPQRSRAMALGFLQALSTVGNMLAAGVTLGLGEMHLSWRWAYFVGAAPALLVVWISHSVHEPEHWQKAQREAAAGGTVNKDLGSIAALFRHARIRRNTIAATLMATAGVGALWGVGFFSPEMIRSELKPHFGESTLVRYSSLVFLVQQVGSFLGIYTFSLLTERVGRKPAFMLFFALAWASVVGFFWGVAGSGPHAFGRAMLLAPVMGFCTLGPFAGYTIYFPELFPTHLRSTGCGFCYNAARILAAVAPFLLGQLSTLMGGLAPAASVVTCIYILGFIGTWMGPETLGKGLPTAESFAAD